MDREDTRFQLGRAGFWSSRLGVTVNEGGQPAGEWQNVSIEDLSVSESSYACREGIAREMPPARDQPNIGDWLTLENLSRFRGKSVVYDLCDILSR